MVHSPKGCSPRYRRHHRDAARQPTPVRFRAACPLSARFPAAPGAPRCWSSAPAWRSPRSACCCRAPRPTTRGPGSSGGGRSCTSTSSPPNGPSWKPLPALFTVPFALFGGAAPWLWLIVARAGDAARPGLRLPDRPAPRRPGRRRAPPSARSSSRRGSSRTPRSATPRGSWPPPSSARSTGTSPDASGRPSRSGSPPRCCARRPGRSSASTACGCSGASAGARPCSSASAFASLPVLWFGPELWGSGNLNRASDRAQQPNADSAAFAANPAVDGAAQRGRHVHDADRRRARRPAGLILLLRRPSLAGHGRIDRRGSRRSRSPGSGSSR